MKDTNRIILTGEVVRDASCRSTPRGNPVTTFTIAFTNDPALKGRYQKRGHVGVVYCKDDASRCVHLLRATRKVTVEGRLQQRSWKTPEGVTRSKTEIVADKLTWSDLTVRER